MNTKVNKDVRIPLERGALLSVENGVQYRIQEEIGRGSSCIAYLATYCDHSGAVRRVRIKECYPLKLPVKRDENGCLSCRDQEAWEREKQKFLDSYRISHHFARERELTNSITGTMDLIRIHGTIYSISSYVEGEKLVFRRNRSLKSVLTIAHSIALVLQAMHEQGYLYLDLKPSNIFLYRETEELIQLFDFDSPVSMDTLRQAVLYTPGFAPLELVQGQFRRIGPWSDVFELGALVYYLLFGRVPSASDCDQDTCFDYRNSIFEPWEYRDSTELLLSSFFHRTLAGYYKDRFQHMEEAVAALEELLTVADPHGIFLHSTKLHAPSGVIGRERELQRISHWWQDQDSLCLYVTGLGGIGKSTLVRKWIALFRDQMDHLLLLDLEQASVRRRIASDESVSIHGISRQREETEREYCRRKMTALKALGEGCRNLLVLDNFSGEITGELQQLLQSGWKLILISRENRYREYFTHLELGELEAETEQRRLFESALNRQLSEEEMPYFRKIRTQVQGHTLILELLGKQIGSSHLTIREAEVLVRRKGFSAMSGQAVDHARDWHFQYADIREIIAGLFARNKLSSEKRLLLKELTLFYPTGMEFPQDGEKNASDVERCQDRERNTSDIKSLQIRENAAIQLEAEGWICRDSGLLKLHPLIHQVVDAWDWQEKECKMADGVMEQQIRTLEAERLRECSYSELIRKLNKAEEMLRTVWNSPALKLRKNCHLLTCMVLRRMPMDREAFILQYGTRLLQNPALYMKSFSAEQSLDICDRVAYQFLKREEHQTAEKVLGTAKKLAGRAPLEKARYYDLLAQHYDFLLHGEYDIAYGNPCLGKMLHAQEKSLYYIEKAEGKACGEKAFLKRAELVILLSRSVPEKKEEIRQMIRILKEKLRELQREQREGWQQYPEMLFSFYMALAWYYTYVSPDSGRIDACVAKAEPPARIVYNNDLDLIDYLYQPYANMKLECQGAENPQTELAGELLQRAIELCDSHGELVSYRRKKKELKQYLDMILS
ncbi:MAG: hypothetical protein Q4B85_10825 [Lachnospiraceae bacterium]|nr:hypothetical protein [Lachnospiraceae bacterium]